MLAEFHFLRPAWLLMLLPLALLWWQLQRGNRRAGNWHTVVDPHLLSTLLTSDGPPDTRRAPYLLGIAWLVLVLALAGPTWQRLPQPVYQVQQYRVIALDLSLPMNVADLKPSRLAQARFNVIDLVKQMDEGQVALIGYGAEPYVVSPLTSDGATITAQVPLLGTELLPTNGPPRADLALDLAGALLTQAGASDGDVILLSNGVNELQRAVSAARNLRASGYRVSVVGTGSAAGAPLPLPTGGFAKNPSGEIVISKLDAEPLAAVANAGGGRFVEARPGTGFIDLLAPGTPARSGDFDTDAADQPKADQWREAGPWLVLLLLPLAALAFRRGWISPLALAAVLLLPPPDAHALSWEDLWWRNDQRAMQSLRSGDPAGAAATFERSDWRAAAAYAAGDYERTLEALGQSAAPPDRGDVAAAYNKGNTLAHLGRLDEAVAAYEQALAADPEDADARYNRDLIQQLLDHQRAVNRQDQQPSQQDAQDDEQASDEQSQGQSDSQEQGEQAQQGGQGEEQDSASDSTAQGGQETTGGESSAEGDTGQQSASQQESPAANAAENDRAGNRDGQQQANAGQQPDDSSDGSQPDSQAGKSNRSEPGSNAAQSSEDGERRETRQDEQSAALDESGAAVTEQERLGPGEESPKARSGAPPAAPGADDADRGEQRQAEQNVAPGGDSGSEENRQAANADSQELAAGRKPDRGDLLGEAPGQAAEQGQQEGRQPLAGGVGETAQAIEQMLRRVDDDPGGLLRQRFLLQHMRRNGQLR
jgi:Ca-activated chloride channel family protein